MNKKVLEGDLSFLNLGDLLQLLSTDSRTGILILHSHHSTESGKIYIKNGNPYDASATNETGINALYSLFGWVCGRFEFIQEDINRNDCVKKRMMAIVLDALRMLDEGAIPKYLDDSLTGNIDDKECKGPKTFIKGPFIEYSMVVDEDEYPDGFNIVTQGRHGNWLWVILDGYVDIIKHTDTGKSLVLTAGAGGFIGSLTTILQPENQRSATAVARGKVQLGVMDTQKIYNELSYISENFKKVLISFDNRLKKITSKYIDIKKDSKGSYFDTSNFKMMINQGDEVQKVFRIIKGEAFVIKKNGANYIKLMTLEKDDFIGNIPFLGLDFEPFSMSVFVTDDLQLEILDLSSLQLEYDKLSTTVKNIIEYTSMCISVTTKNAFA